MNYYISDLHFFHANALNFDQRPFSTVDEMNDYIVQHWNKKVTNNDVVYILGDVSLLHGKEKLIELVAILKGKKVLIQGNHDILKDYRYKQLFYEIHDYQEITDHIKGQSYNLVLSHYPILMWKNQHRGSILLYGHTHNSGEDQFFQSCIAQMNERDDLNLFAQGGTPMLAINVGCMHPWIAYEPRTLEEILEGYNQVIQHPEE
ncbi:metallophosphoesterase [Holdemania massiliensis]|uniref:metallophosphoesterase n=1 Tax=Holdemania massiliensis TaxID=1468449 RepID=UPI001F0700D3|nr:metallophosphoesterase family protein [Holdemania massiliensis]